MTPALRQISGLQWASPTVAGTLPTPESKSSRAGIAYQKKVGKALLLVANKVGGKLTPEPWFKFYDDLGPGQIVPDFIFSIGDIHLVIEVKYTFLPEAVLKLQGLYLPVVKAANACRTRPLLICRNLTPASLEPGVRIISNLTLALFNSDAVPVLQYLGTGSIRY